RCGDGRIEGPDIRIVLVPSRAGCPKHVLESITESPPPAATPDGPFNSIVPSTSVAPSVADGRVPMRAAPPAPSARATAAAKVPAKVAAVEPANTQADATPHAAADASPPTAKVEVQGATRVDAPKTI